MNKNFSVVILAAGKGKRMNNPDLPKVLVELAGKPLLGHVLDQVNEISADNTVVVVGHKKEKVISFVENNYNGNISCVEQNEQLGTGHAVDQAEPVLKDYPGDTLILCGDVPLLKASTLQNFIDFHNQQNADVTVLSTKIDNPFGYGRIVRDSEGNFLKITEEKDADEEEKKINEINSGVYILNTASLFESLKKVSNNNAQGEYYLTDIIDILRGKNANVQAWAGAEFNELQGVNSRKTSPGPKKHIMLKFEYNELFIRIA